LAKTAMIRLTVGLLPKKKKTREHKVITRNTAGNECFLFRWFTTGTASM
jgi:hypothetical protein